MRLICHGFTTGYLSKLFAEYMFPGPTIASAHISHRCLRRCTFIRVLASTTF